MDRGMDISSPNEGGNFGGRSRAARHHHQPGLAPKTKLSSGIATDDAGKPILAGTFIEPNFTPEERVWVETTDTEGRPIKVPEYMVRMAKVMDQAVAKGKFIMPVGNGTSAINLFSHDKDPNDILGVSMSMLGVGALGDPQRPHSPLIENGHDPRPFDLTHIDEEDGKPTRMFVPGSTSIEAVNDYLAERYGPRFQVRFGITALSHLGANIATGGEGGSRRKVPTVKLYVKDESRGIRIVEDPQEIQAYFGTQGYAGYVMGMELEVSEVPPIEEYLMVTLGAQETREAYTDHASQVLAALYEYNLFPDQFPIQVEEVEIMDRNGAEASLRQAAKGKSALGELAAKFKKDILNGRALALMIRVRHDLGGNLESSNHPEAKKFMERLAALMDAGVIADFKTLKRENHFSIQDARTLREGMTHDARKEGDEIREAGGHTTSRDDEIRLRVDIDPSDPQAVDGKREDVRRAIAVIMGIHMDARDEILAADPENRDTPYGHLAPMGIDLHERNAGYTVQAIKDAVQRVHERLMALDGWTRGEKENPRDLTGLQREMGRDPEGMERKSAVIERGGKAFNFRIPPPLRQVMATARQRTRAAIAA